MLDAINTILDRAKADIEQVSDVDQLQALRRQLLGKKGKLTGLLKQLGKLDPQARRAAGQATNQAKNTLTEALNAKLEVLLDQASSLDFKPDLSLPGIAPSNGGLHPIQQMCYDLDDSFISLGFEIFQEGEVTSEFYAFDALNFPPEHPARETMDTYWIDGTENEHGLGRLCLRPHITGASVRYLQKHGAPARFVYPGRVYRNEQTDARHERAFFQYEALIVEKDFPFASGQLLVRTILEKAFGREVEIRMRAGFFPFVEPGFEIDMRCLVCGGVGCKVCKNVGWIEVMPGGTPHPNVLSAAGLDPAIWSGFYINVGLDRLVMMRYGIDDVRLFHSADLRFLSQYR